MVDKIEKITCFFISESTARRDVGTVLGYSSVLLGPSSTRFR